MADSTGRGVLFDVDGTLVDTNYLHTLAWWQAFRRFGHDAPMAGIHRAVGMGGDKLIGHLLGADRDASEDGELESTHAAVYSSYWPSIRRFEGARELLQRCAADGLTVVLASSSSTQEVTVMREIIDADDVIAGATSSSDAEHSKPSPDILTAALDSAGLRAENSVFVGDAVWDVLAASELGIPTIAVLSGGTSAAELREAGAVEVYADVAQLLAAFEGSALSQLPGPQEQRRPDS
ncbi:HAD family hydrolase [Arthrobacter sp. Br18]|uniref:HAD family hydrolase n=1 Tax=Arthrobacter sp. Br18 TaxID=1312954 RepID=UPI0004B9742D|nr:HAD family hydrolase [Arthrobacter sp. Br18]